jgi:hypothetical protein
MGPPLLREAGSDYCWSLPFYWGVTLLAFSFAVGRSVRLLLVFASTVNAGFSLLEIHDQDFCCLLDVYVFRNGASSSTREGVGVSA